MTKTVFKKLAMALSLSAKFCRSRCDVAWGVNRKGRLKLLCSGYASCLDWEEATNGTE